VNDGFQQEHQFGISTGSENTRVYLSLNYFNESGLFEKDNLDRYAARLNVDQQVSDAFRVGMQSQFTYYDRDRQRDPTNIANKINPLTPAYDDNGDLIIRPHGGRDISPLADLEPNAYENNTLTTRFFPTFYAELLPIPNLSLRSNLSANLTNSRVGIFRAANTIDRNGAAPEAIYESSNSRSITFENIANYRTDIDRHTIGLTGIVSYQFGKNDFGSASGTNQLLPSQLYFGLLNAPDGRAIESGYSESSLMSYAARANYSWDSKYLFTFTGRFDGSSKLSEGNQWAFFPSAAFAWRIIDEPFMGEDGWIFSDLKVRLSYGVSGNDAIDPYSTQSSLRRVPFSFGEEAAPGFTYSPTVGNPNLEWELSHTANLGFDIGFWNNRIYASIDLYNTETSNLLLDRFLPLTSGVTSVTQNIGETRNRGIEIALSSKNVVTNDLFWQTDLTFFSNKEEIVSLVSDGDDIGNGWFIGQPTQVFYDYDMIGIWQLNEADEAAQYGQQPGDIRVRDVDGDGTISSTEDRVIIGSPRPKWSGGIENSVRFRNFDINIFVYARIGQMINYEYNRSYKPNGVENGARVNYWTPENASNEFPRPDASRAAANYQFYNSMAYEDGSFVKIRNATIGYTLPSSLAERFSLRRLRVYVTGRNLLTFSKITDYDPERGGGLSFPMTRVLVTGFNLDF
jgi:TonB-dependent starch-binding outer membrane protein SusC